MDRPKRAIPVSLRLSAWMPIGVFALLMLMVAWMMQDPFVPSLQAGWLGPALALLAAAMTAVVAAALHGGPPRWASPADRRDGAIRLLFCAGYFLVLHLALSYCVPLLLHRLAGPRPATQTLAVQVRESIFARGCRNAAILPGDSVLLPRRVCRLPDAMVDALRERGRIELRGQRSYFGIQVEDYAVAPPPSR